MAMYERMGARRHRLGALAVSSLLMLTACSSSGSGKSSSVSGGSAQSSATSPTNQPSGAGSSSPSGAASTQAYSGVEASLPQSYPAPKAGAVKNCKLGYMNIYAAIPSLISSQRAAEAEAKRLGCSITTLDDQLSPTKQVDNMNQLITQKVGGIMVYPVVPTALAPSVAKAKAAGIYVVSQNTPVDATQSVPSGFDTTIIQSFDHSAYLRAQAVAAKMPGATFAIIGLAAPVASLQYLDKRTKYWAEKFGLKFVDEVDAQQDNAAAATAATTALLAKQKNLKVIFAYNDTTAVAVSVTARTSGRSQIAIVGSDGVKVGIDGVKAGNLFGTTRTDFATIGVQMVDACYDLLSGQKSLPRKIVAKITFVSKSNVASITPSG